MPAPCASRPQAPPFVAPKATVLYILRICDEAHRNCLKIGETSLPDGVDLQHLSPDFLREVARRRIDQYTRTAAIAYELLHAELGLVLRGRRCVAVRDTDVHKLLLCSGVKQATFDHDGACGREWFEVDLPTAQRAIAAAKEGRRALGPHEISRGENPIVFRPEQLDAIEKTCRRFRKSSKMLWNAKMRFGKTLTALQVVRKMGFRRSLILTHRPVVDAVWFDNFLKIFGDEPRYRYGSTRRGETLATLEAGAAADPQIGYVYFASLQDLRGSEQVGGKFAKNEGLFAIDWELLIIDEAHEGTQTRLGQSVLSELRSKRTKELHLSGTPFNLLEDFDEEEIFTWDYIMEQRAKTEWELTHCGDPNPYAALPQLHIYTYRLGEEFAAYRDETLAFNFREFFRTGAQGSLVHERDVLRFLDLLVREDPQSCYPFANEHFRRIFRHTLWVLPSVRAARALSELLQQHPVFGSFAVANVAGEGDADEELRDALERVQSAIGDKPGESYSVTLTCGRLTTGVSVPEWTGVFMLAGTVKTDAKRYMQTIFRVQTPATIDGLRKEHCYVFDFAPDRTLQVLASVPRVEHHAERAGTEAQKKALDDFLNFCPVIAVSGSRMEALDTPRMLEQLKKAAIERVVTNGFEDARLYNDELLKLNAEDLRQFKELKGIIGQSKAIGSTGSVDINAQGLTEEQYAEQERLEKRRKELSEAERHRLRELRERGKCRRDAISVLRGISVRLPLLIYGATFDEESRELSIHHFAELIDPESWREFMPSGVTKALFRQFTKYYDDDVFRGACRRIRAMTRAADRLTVEERIERIAALFDCFRNPDKETVLTPWRVVNLHLSSCFGGYSFFAEDGNSPLDTPRRVDRGALTREVFAADSRVLEINSKTGLYPLLLAYNIYRRRLAEAPFTPDSAEAHRALWDKVLSENVFVVCKTPMAKSITRRTLAGFRKAKTRLLSNEQLIDLVHHRPQEFLSVVRKLTGKNMNINAVVGNPPYQEIVAKKETENGQKCSRNLFHYFQLEAERIGRYTSLIYPGKRWIHRSGKGLAEFGRQQMNDAHLMKLIYFPKAEELFEQVAIADGLSIVLKDMRKTQRGFEYVYAAHGTFRSCWTDCPGDKLFSLHPVYMPIVEKLEAAVRRYGSLHESVLPRTLFAIESNFVEKNPHAVRVYEEDETYDPRTEIKLFTNDRAGKSGRARWYVTKRETIRSGLAYLDRWKVVVSSANAGGQKRDNQLAVMDNHSAFGRSRVALKTFATEREARNFFRYASSRLIRFAFQQTDEALTSLALKVPDLQDYTDENELIDYEQDIDRQLVALFGLSEDEWQCVERFFCRGSSDCM
ncbi:MAG: Eco57I restriction-modification methylase domain-containing protein [Akkermansia sp.]